MYYGVLQYEEVISIHYLASTIYHLPSTILSFYLIILFHADEDGVLDLRQKKSRMQMSGLATLPPVS
jgi:hypothetical protein